MDLFLINCLILLWLTFALPRLDWNGIPRRARALVLAAGWAAVLALWGHDLMHWALVGMPPPPLRPAGVPAAPPATRPPPAAPPGRLFHADLIAGTGDGASVSGLLPSAGPLPDRNLPRVRGALGPVVRLRIAAGAAPVQLRLSFSLRLHQRHRAGLAIFLNDRPVRNYRLSGPAWTEDVVDLAAPAGESEVELRDVPLAQEPDWDDYLERYPDVRRNLLTLNLPLEAGAEAHYEAAGRAEGRTVRRLDTLPPAPDTYRFLFRQLTVEGYRQP